MSKFARQGGMPRSNRFERAQQDKFGAPSPKDWKGASGYVLRNSVQQRTLRDHELPERNSVVIRNRDDLVECRQWLKDFGIRAQMDVEVMDAQGKFKHAFVFKRSKHAAQFKLAWG